MKYALLAFTIMITIIISNSNIYSQDQKLYLNHKSYSNVTSPQYHPQPVHELIGVAKNNWKFDGIELSMDALINEGGSNGKQFTAFIRQLAVDLDSLQISKLWTTHRLAKGLQETFKLHLQIDMASQLIVDLDDSFRVDAVKEVMHRLPIDSYSIVISDYWSMNNLEDTAKLYGLTWDKLIFEVPKLHDTYSFEDYWTEFGWHDLLVDMRLSDKQPFNQLINDIIYDRATTKSRCVKLIRFNSSVGDDWTDAKRLYEQQVYSRVLKRIEGLDTIISVQTSRPLKWTVREDDRIGYGSEGFKNSIAYLRKLMNKDNSKDN